MSTDQPKPKKEQALNVKISADVHKAAKLRAVEDETTLTEIVERALRQALGLPEKPQQCAPA